MVSPLQSLIAVPPADNRANELASVGGMLSNLYGTVQGVRQNSEAMDFRKEQIQKQEAQTAEQREIMDGARHAIIAHSIKDPERRNLMLGRRASALDEQGRDSSHTREIMGLPFNQQNDELLSMGSVLINNYPGGPDALMGSLFGDTKPDEISIEFAKEQRKVAQDSVKDIDKRAGEIRSSIGKVEGLESQMRNKNRQAIAAGIMNVARLISPGVVTDTDFQNLSGAQNPLALAFDIISGRNPDVAKQLGRYVDPTNPETFDVDGLMSVATSVAASEAPVIMDQFAQARSQAERAGLRPNAIDAIFGDKPNIEAIMSIKPREAPKGGGDDKAERIKQLREKHGL